MAFTFLLCVAQTKTFWLDVRYAQQAAAQENYNHWKISDLKCFYFSNPNQGRRNSGRAGGEEKKLRAMEAYKKNKKIVTNYVSFFSTNFNFQKSSDSRN